MNELTEHSVVLAKSINSVEVYAAVRTCRTKILFVQVLSAEKRRTARPAKVLRRHWGYSGQTILANRNSRNLLQRPFTDAAIVGKNKVEGRGEERKKTRRRRRFREWIRILCCGAIRETREGTPPLIQHYTTYKESRKCAAKVAEKQPCIRTSNSKPVYS